MVFSPNDADEASGVRSSATLDAAAPAAGPFPDFDRYDGMGLAQLLRSGQVSRLELVETVIARIEQVNPALNAIVHRLYDDARRAAVEPPASSKLAGVPVLLKDLLSPYAGAPFCSGSRFYRGFVADHDAELVRRYKRAGLIFIAKTNTPEFGIMPVTEPVLFGPTRNPWDLERTPGGSSGGAAAAVAAGVVPIAHGGDGGGSIRIPASCCGLFGLKPSRGRNPAGPDNSEHWLGFAMEHALTRTVRDSAALLDITAGPEPTAQYHAPVQRGPFLDEVGAPPGRLRIAFSDKPQLPSEVHPECKRALMATVKLCEELGHDVEEAAPDVDGDQFAMDFFTMVSASIAAGIREAEDEVGRKAQPDELEVATWLAGLLGEQLSSGDAIYALWRLHALARRTHAFHQRYDLLLTPTLGSPPLPIGALQPTGAEALAHRTIANLKLGRVLKIRRVIQATVQSIFRFVPFTPLANVTGQPAMSVPLYWTEQGLPIGTQFTARFGEEALLFRVAAQLEAARPWHERWPPTRAG